MLSRIGNSLFWMGRYLERAEHIARYLKVQYVSSMDAPLTQNNVCMLQSMLNMAGVAQNYLEHKAEVEEEAVIEFVAVGDKNPFSIQAYISHVRENARGARDSLSTELWEHINQFYHIAASYTPEKLRYDGVHLFAQKVEENSYIIKGYIDNTLIRNEVWLLLTLGVHLERATQIALILQAKLTDLEKMENTKQGSPLENYLWTTVLQSAEARDMFLRHYKTTPNRADVFDFLIFSTAFPKSIAYNLTRVKELIEAIGFQDQKSKASIGFMAGKLATQFEYLTVTEVDGSITEFLENTLNSIYDMARLIEDKYLNYDMTLETSYYDYTVSN